VIGLDYVLAGYVQLAAGTIKCTPKRAPQVSVSAQNSAIKYDHTRSQAQLDGFSMDTVSPYGPEVQSHVGGLMSGEAQISHELQYMQESYPMLNSGCLFIDKINVKLKISPTIYVAREYKKTGCMYRAVLEHEKKHVALDREIMNKYTNLIARDVEAYVRKTGSVRGPITIRRMPQAQKSVNDGLAQLIRGYSQKMNEERRRRQQQIDTLEEYNRVNNLCRGRD
jgi:hypothetical protein